jgi:hypothetical protein
MPGLLPAQLVEKYEKAASQNASGFIQFYGAGPSGGAANMVTITDGVTPEVYTVADNAPGAAIVDLVAQLAASLLVDAWNVSGDICAIRAKTPGTLPVINVALGAFGGAAEVRAHNCIESANCNLTGGRDEEVEVVIYGQHTVTAQEVAALLVVAGTDEVPLEIIDLDEAAILRSVVRRDAAGLVQSMINVWCGITALGAGAYMLSVRDVGAVLQTGDVLDFCFSTQ